MPKRMEMLGRTAQAPTPFEATTGRPAMQAGDGGTAHVDMGEKRIDPSDGNAYTRQSFLDVYGEWGYLSVWDSAQPVAAPAPEETPEQLLERCKDFMEERAAAAAATWQDPPARQQLVDELVRAMGEKGGGATGPTMAAYGLAGAVREMGAASLSKFEIEAAMGGLLEQKAKSDAVTAAVTAVSLITDSLGQEAVAFAKPLLGRLLKGSEGSVKTREMTDNIVKALTTAAGSEDVQELVGAVVQSLGESSRKAKAVALALLNGLARRDNEPEVLQAVAASVPVVMPKLIECCHETDPKISDTANSALDAVTLTIDHSETQKLRKLLLSAILFADKHTHECLDALSEMTFVNALEAPSLALMVPVLARGLREKGSAVVKQASMTSSNIFALVRHPRDLAPFLPILMPELKSAAGHSNPEVREKALIALGVVQKGQADHDKDDATDTESSAVVNAGDADDYLVDVRGFILAFSGRVLLKSAELLIRIGHCYGIVGQNGAGKTTLLTRIAAGDIDGFPSTLNCYYVQHEILDEGSTTVATFMTRQAPDGTALKTVTDSLDQVGFSKVMQNGPVSDLSGGWRMKLAIARSMLWSPDLLLLDEPTNHLDVAAVEWLGQYISSLKGKTTVMIVSHDYDFLNIIATDIIHMTNQRMKYHNCGFKEFQDLNPQVVEALPSVERTVNTAATEADSAEATAAAKRQQRLSKLEPEPEPEPEPAPAPVAKKAPIAPGDHKAGAERIRSAMEEKEAAALARAKERALKADALVEECEVQLAEAKKNLADATKKLKICMVKNDAAQMKVKKWIGKKLGKDWAEVRKEVKKFGDNLVKRQEAVAECEQAMQDAENLVAEAMQDRAGDRSFIGQMEAQMKQAAEDVEPTTMEEAVEAATRKDAALRDKASELLPIEFPDPGKLSADKKGFLSTKATVIKIDDLTFAYPGAEKPVILDVDFQMSLQSRCALLGKNGAGKTTLMKLIIGELSIKNEDQDKDKDEDEEEEEEESEITVADGLNSGQIWKHRNVRVSYVAQHSMHHLEAALDATPITYIQNRFRFGKDKETTQRFALTPEEQKLMQKKGAINGVVERKLQGKQILYGVSRTGRKDDHDIDWEMQVNLEMKDPYVMKLVKNFDEEFKNMASGMNMRPTTREEVRAHLGSFGLLGDVIDNKIRRLSGGQRSRLVLAAAMWSKPHLLALDEPTNYLDNDTLAALTHALRSFKHGGVIVISHNVKFVNALCNEWWSLKNGGGITRHTEPPDQSEIAAQE